MKEVRVTCLGFNLIIEELLFELGESVVGAVVVQIQGVEDIPGREHKCHGGQVTLAWKTGGMGHEADGLELKTTFRPSPCSQCLHLGRTCSPVCTQILEAHDANESPGQKIA